MDDLLTETLSRIRLGDGDSGWWRQLLDYFGHSFIAPDFLNKPALGEWLDEDEVRNDLKLLATKRIIGSDVDEAIVRDRLAKSYAERTGEAQQLAGGSIDVVTAILVAGYIGSIPGEQRAIAGMVQTGTDRIVAAVENVERSLSGLEDPIIRRSHTANAAKDLADVLLLRTISPDRSRSRIQELAGRIGEGDLVQADVEVKNRVRYWVARLSAGDKRIVDVAKAFRERVRKDDPICDLSIIDALIAETEGDSDRGIRLLRDRGDAESRTVLFGVLARSRGADAALSTVAEEVNAVDAGIFTALGWRSWAGCMAEVGRWDEAAERLARLEGKRNEAPALSLLEGIINAQLLLPEDRRGLTAGPVLFVGIAPNQGERAEGAHRSATECFELAALGLRDIDEDDCEVPVTEWHLWLRLMNPREDNRKDAQNEVRRNLEGEEPDVNLVLYSWVFEIEFEREPLRLYLSARDKLGGLNDEERRAEYFLTWSSVDTGEIGVSEFLAYLEEHRAQLSEVLPANLLVAMRIESLIRDNQVERGRTDLAESGGDLDEVEVARLTAMIDAHIGLDARTDLERAYQETGSLIDLRNLINCVEHAGDREALLPLLHELMSQQRTIANATRIVACLARRPFFDHRRILEFLESNADLVAQSPELQTAKAWALFQNGHFSAAKSVNDDLLDGPEAANAFALDFNIAMGSGDWDRLPAIAEREWPRRQEHNPETLLILAQVAGRQGRNPDRALALAKLAAEKAPDDPRVLAVAFDLHFRFGRDHEADPDWLVRAFEKSSADDGPVWSMDFRTVVTEWIPERRERLAEIESKWLAGEIPTGIAASLFHIPLTRLLMQIPESNLDRLDRRWTIVVPVVFGGREKVELEGEWVVGLDISSILVLHFLDLLEPIFDAFKEIRLAPDVMSWLLREQDRVMFHQPSQVRDAQRVQTLSRRGRLRAAETSGMPSGSAAEEVGEQLGALLHAAKECSGKVVCVLPIHRPGSLLERTADTADWNDQIVSVSDFCKLLHTQGIIDRESHVHAQAFFHRQGKVEIGVPDRSMVEGSIYLDGLALSYLQDAKVLDQVCAAGLDLRVHPDVLEYLDELVAAGDSSEDLAGEIDAVRSILRRAVEADRASYLPREVNADDPIQYLEEEFTATRSLLAAAGECDAICIDDRYVNSKVRFLVQEGKKSQVPIACVLDVLDRLVAMGHLSSERLWAVRHKLRAGGFVLVPVEEEELWHWLRTAAVEDGHLSESAELRVIRQSFARIAALGLSNEQEVDALSAQIPIACASVIRSLWRDEALNSVAASVLSDWIWRHLVVAGFVHHEVAEGGSADGLLHESVRRSVSLVLLSLGVISEDRCRRYADWVEGTVLHNLRVGKGELVQEALSSMCSAIAERGDEATAYGNSFLNLLPESARRYVLSTFPEHARRWGFKTDRVFVLEPSVSVVDRELFEVAKDVLSGGEGGSLRSVEGREVLVSVDCEDGNVVLAYTVAESNVRTKMSDLKLLSPDAETRLECLTGIVERLGPTARDMGDLSSALAKREPSEDELSEFFREAANGVASVQGILAHKIHFARPVNVADIIPQDIAYYEGFVGQAAEDRDPEGYIREILIPYRRALLGRDLRAGLDVCCLGALRDDLCPGQWIEGVENDVVWDSLSKCDTDGSPLALLGALDVALYRDDDERFRGFAEQAILRLCDERFGHGESFDIYELLWCFVQLMINQINQMENGSKRAGYWKRMCAWMQAQFVVRCLAKAPSEIAREELKSWCQSSMGLPGAYSELVDFREEPMLLHSTRTSPGDLRSEVLGRLAILRARHEGEGRPVPYPAEIDQALERASERGDRVKCEFPGPLEGAREIVRALPGDLAEELRTGRPDLGDPVTWQIAGNCSQVFRLGEAELVPLREAAGKKGSSVKAGHTRDFLFSLEIASVIAKSTRDTALADVVADRLVDIATVMSDVHDVYMSVQICLQAAAAYEDRTAWMAWLDERLARIASAIPGPPNKCLGMFVEQLDSVETVLPADAWFHRRARYVAASGASWG